MGSPSTAAAVQRERSNTDLTSVRQIQEKEHLKATNPDQVEQVRDFTIERHFSEIKNSDGH